MTTNTARSKVISSSIAFYIFIQSIHTVDGKYNFWNFYSAYNIVMHFYYQINQFWRKMD